MELSRRDGASIMHATFSKAEAAEQMNATRYLGEQFSEGENFLKPPPLGFSVEIYIHIQNVCPYN